MQFKENRTLVIIFRICIFAAFFTGMMYFAKFVSFTGSRSKEQAIQALSSFCRFFHAYMVFTVLSFVLSIVCFKTTSMASTVVRTISLAVTSIVLFLNMSLVGLFKNAIQAESGDYAQLMELNNKLDKMTNDPTIMDKALLSFASVLVMLVLAITSVVALVKDLKRKAKSADAA